MLKEMSGVRKDLQRLLGQDLPDYVWDLRDLQDLAKEYLAHNEAEQRDETWSLLEEVSRARLGIWNESRKEVLREVRSGTAGSSQDMREAEKRDIGESARSLDVRELVGDRTRAMTEAMSALFALYGDQIPEVKEFREKVRPSGGFLTADEAHALIASYAARVFDLRLFKKWNIPLTGHKSDILSSGPRGADFNPVDDWTTLRIDPPGITKTVRYADHRSVAAKEDVDDIRCMAQDGAIFPVITGLPVESHGDHVYSSWLWPGSVIDELYDLSVELASSFDWPLASAGNLSGTRPRSESAAWFVLTGEVPQVRPIEARWEMKRGTTHLSPQWRIRLTIPPWLPEEEVIRALRLLRKQMPKGRKLSKEARTLEVTRFVWQQERRDGYRKRPPWKAWCERWNEEHPGHRFKTPNAFRMAFVHGNAAVKELNFNWPQSRRVGTSSRSPRAATVQQPE